VDGIESDLGERGHVVRLNVYDDAGRAIAGRYGLSAVPTFLVFRASDQPVARFVGRPDHGQVLRALLGP
jgi:thioredoxin-like negative regulator of GroEL